MSDVSYNCSCTGTYPTKTLADLRVRLLQRLGFGAQAANPPPGMAGLLDTFLQDAQSDLYQQPNGFSRLERFYNWPLVAGTRLYDFADNADAATLATPSNVQSSTDTSGGTLAAGTSYYRVSAINANGETLASAEISQVSTGATSVNTLTWDAVEVDNGQAPVTGYRIYGRTTGAEQLMDEVGLVLTWDDDGSLTPSGALPTTNTTAYCTKLMEPTKITYVGISRADSNIYPLLPGISPSLRGSPAPTGQPSRYEFRSCIEIWPTPTAADETSTLLVKGKYGLLSFEEDEDVTTIDWLCVFQMALFLAKSHYGHPDAQNYYTMATDRMAMFIQDAHGTNRYVPGEQLSAPPPQPTMTSFYP